MVGHGWKTPDPSLTCIEIAVLYFYTSITAVGPGVGGSRSILFSIASDGAECQLAWFLFRIKNIIPSRSYRVLKSRKYIQSNIARANFYRNSLKSTLNSNSSYSFWHGCLKLGSYFQGTKTKLSVAQNFDIGLRSENIEFLNRKTWFFINLRQTFSK